MILKTTGSLTLFWVELFTASHADRLKSKRDTFLCGPPVNRWKSTELQESWFRPSGWRRLRQSWRLRWKSSASTPMRTPFQSRYLIHKMARALEHVFHGCKITNSCLERVERFALRAVSRFECGVVPPSFFDVPFPPRYLPHEFIMRSSRLEDSSSWLQEAESHALRTTAHCENAMLPKGFLPGLPRESGRVLTESDVGIDQGSPVSIASLGCESNHGELPTSRMLSVAELGFADAFRNCSLGIGDIRMALRLLTSGWRNV